jgi:hypothetical protein
MATATAPRWCIQCGKESRPTLAIGVDEDGEPACIGHSVNEVKLMKHDNQNGQNGRTKTRTLGIAATLTEREGEGRPGLPPEQTRIVETWCSDLSLINYNGHQFGIRQTQHIADKADVTLIRLNRIELEMFIAKAQNVLAEAQ